METEGLSGYETRSEETMGQASGRSPALLTDLSLFPIRHDPRGEAPSRAANTVTCNGDHEGVGGSHNHYAPTLITIR